MNRVGVGTRLLVFARAVLMLAMLAIGVPTALLMVAQERFGGGSPFAGVPSPSSWSVDSVGGALTDRLTDRTIADIVIRVSLLVAWVAVIVIVLTVAAELAHMVRHDGMALPDIRGFGISQRTARIIASGLLVIIPLFTSPNSAIARGGSTLVAEPRAPATVDAADAAVPTSPAPNPARSVGERVVHTPLWRAPVSGDYVVRAGDSVFGIAERMVGPDQSAVDTYAEAIVDANLGRRMPDGRTFDNAAFLDVGWVLDLPAVPSAPSSAPADGVHRVEPGDSLWSIADEELGDPMRWPDVFEANKGRTFDNGGTLQDPDLIQPGWDLVMPADGRSSDGGTAEEVRVDDPAVDDSPAGAPSSSVHDGPGGAEAGADSDESMAQSGGAGAVTASESDVSVADEDKPDGPGSSSAEAGSAGGDAEGRSEVSPDSTLLDGADRVQVGSVAKIVHVEPHPEVETEAAESTRVGPDPETPADVADLNDESSPSGGGTGAIAGSSSPRQDNVWDGVDGVVVGRVVGDDQVPDADAAVAGAAEPSDVVSSLPGNLDAGSSGRESSAVGDDVAPVVGVDTDDLAPDRADEPSPFDEDGGESDAPRLLTLGRAAMLSAGILTLLAVRRRNQLRRARPRSRIPDPVPAAAATERLLRSIDSGERFARVDIATRAVALPLIERDERIVAVSVATDGALELRATGPVELPAPWEGGSSTWHLPASVPLEMLADDARRVGGPCPTLVQLGSDEAGRDVYVDLEALGAVEVGGPGAQADAIVAALAATLAGSVLAEVTTLVGLGVADDAFLGHRNYVPVRDPQRAFEAAADAIGSTATMTRSTFELRARGTSGETWEPAVILAGAAAGTITAPSNRTGLALVSASPIHGPSSRLAPDGDAWLLLPADIRLTPVGLTPDDLASIADLVNIAVPEPAVSAGSVFFATLSDPDHTIVGPPDEDVFPIRLDDPVEAGPIPGSDQKRGNRGAPDVRAVTVYEIDISDGLPPIDRGDDPNASNPATSAADMASSTNLATEEPQCGIADTDGSLSARHADADGPIDEPNGVADTDADAPQAVAADGGWDSGSDRDADADGHVGSIDDGPLDESSRVADTHADAPHAVSADGASDSGSDLDADDDGASISERRVAGQSDAAGASDVMASGRAGGPAGRRGREVFDGSCEPPLIRVEPGEVADPELDSNTDGEPRAAPAGAASPYALLVRLIGAVEIVDREGGRVEFERSKTRELVAWLATHRERSTRSAARTALWELDVRDATFANVVSEARRALARLTEPAPGEEWVGRTNTDALPLHDLVVTDADLIRHALDVARLQPPAQAIGTLAPAVDLITGMPFAGTSYLWPDSEGITSNLVLLATSATTELAAHCLSIGDIEGVFGATGRGLQVLPGHEELIGLRMEAHARAGDHAGVRQEWESYERVINGDPWSDGEPAPKLVELRRRLLNPSR